MSFNHFHFSKVIRILALKGLSILSILGLLLGALPVMSTQAATTVLYAVPGGQTIGACSSWANACELSYALKTAGPRSEIWIKTGTYLPGRSIIDAFVLKSGVALYGGFLGVETARDQANWYAHPTILSGDVAGNDLPDLSHMEENNRHVVIARDVDSTAILKGFYIRSGNAQEGTGTDGLGGGVQVYNASPTLENLVLSYNAAARGGGIGCYGNSTLYLTNTAYEKNLAQVGGGLDNEAGCTTALFGAVFNTNRAKSGGAIYNSSSMMIASNATISGNTATTTDITTATGGGIANNVSTLALINSIVWGNHHNQEPDQIYSPVNSTVVALQDIIQGGYSKGTDIRDIDPLFAENPTSGPDAAWGTADDILGNLMLRYASPAIDTGINTGPANFTQYLQGRDLRNWPRVIDHPRPDTAVGPLVDLGAYEAGIVFARQGATGRQDGSSWADAFPSLQAALAFTHAGDEVWAFAGTYSVGAARTDSFLLKNDVAIYGGFAGTELFRAERNWVNNMSVLSGVTAPGGTKAYHVVSGVNVGPSAVLDGFTIQDGNADGAQAPDNQGGGIYLNSASPTLENLLITQNAAAQGGGVYVTGQPAGALSNVTVSNNLAGLGGGLYLNSVNLAINRVIFQGNIANSGQGEGGGIYSNGASYSIIGGRFQRNTALNGGGVANVGASAPRLVDVYFLGNTASNGGGMYNYNGASPDISNVVFAGNASSIAGAVYNKLNSAPILRSTTIASNPGGAFYAETNDAAQEPQLVNVIGWDNSASPIITSGSLPTIKYSLLEGGCPKQLQESCLNVLSSNPLFVRMPSSGLDNQWGTVDDDYGDLHLQAGSKAIDAGMNSGVAAGLTTDIVGRPRFIDDPATPDSGAGTPPIVDMGAYEYHNAPSVTVQILSVTAEPSYAGQEVVVSFQVTGSLGTATGLVQVTDGVESCSAAADQGQCHLTFKTSGQKTLIAHFQGDSNYEPADSAPSVHQVNAIPTQVTLSLDPPGLTGAGQKVHATFTVSPAIQTAYLPDGMVTVSSEAGSCSATLIEGGCTLAFATPGTYHVKAEYGGNVFFAAQSSNTVTYEVQALRATQTTLTITPTSPTRSGATVHAAFSVIVTDALGGTATGDVMVTDGVHTCQASLVNGQGGCELTLMGVGKHSLVANYQGEGVFGPSSSVPVIHDVLQALYFPIISR